jgi:hypothetical protein
VMSPSAHSPCRTRRARSPPRAGRQPHLAETIIGLAWFDHYSYLFQTPDWNPSQENINGLVHHLHMVALANYVG